MVAQPLKILLYYRPGGPNLGEQVCYELDIRTPLNPNNQQTGTSIDKLGQDLETDRVGNSVILIRSSEYHYLACLHKYIM